MTAKQAANLQWAIWFFTNGVKPPNHTVQVMIHSVHKNLKIPDNYWQLINTKHTCSNSSSTITILLNTTSSSTNQTYYLGNNTTTQIIKSNCKCTSYYTIITTIIKYYKTETNTTTVNTYKNITTNTKNCTTTLKYKNWKFSAWKGSHIQGKKQKLIFWKATPKTLIKHTNNKSTSEKIFSESSTESNTKYWNTTCTSKKVVKCWKPCEHYGCR